MPTNLILTGGHTHRFDIAAPALAALLNEQGINSEVTNDIEAGLATLGKTAPDLLTVYALRWSMAIGDKYAPHRARWAFTLSADGRASIESHLARGGGCTRRSYALTTGRRGRTYLAASGAGDVPVIPRMAKCRSGSTIPTIRWCAA
jgi:hypothetical protein